MNPNQLQHQSPEPVHVNIDLADTTAIECSCGGDVFAPGMKLRRVSPLLTGGETRPLTVQAVYCVKCGKALQFLLPKALQEPCITV